MEYGYCSKCKEEKPYRILAQREVRKVDHRDIEVILMMAICDKCKTEIPLEEINRYNDNEIQSKVEWYDRQANAKATGSVGLFMMAIGGIVELIGGLMILGVLVFIIFMVIAIF